MYDQQTMAYGRVYRSINTGVEKGASEKHPSPGSSIHTVIVRRTTYECLFHKAYTDSGETQPPTWRGPVDYCLDL